MDSPTTMGEVMPMFYIGEHQTKRPLPVSTELVHHAQDLGVGSSVHITGLHVISALPQAILLDTFTGLHIHPSA